MRLRITYLLPSDSENSLGKDGIFNIDEIDVSKIVLDSEHSSTTNQHPSQSNIASLQIDRLKSVKEVRLAIPADAFFGESSLQWSAIADDTEGFHIRWCAMSTPDSEESNSVNPLASHISPGLSIFYKSHKNSVPSELCILLRKIFYNDLACVDPEKSFFPLPSHNNNVTKEDDEENMRNTYYFYHLLPTLEQAADYFHEKVCAGNDLCLNYLQGIPNVSYLGIDFEKSAGQLIVSADWNSPQVWTETHQKRLDSSVSMEIGVVKAEKSGNFDEIRVGGLLTNVGHDDAPKPALFSFPSRHHRLPGKLGRLRFRSHFEEPTGLHPILKLEFPPAFLIPPQSSCSLNAFFTIPSYLFVNKFELSDPELLKASRLVGLREVHGETDLEAPLWIIEKWGSLALFELATPYQQRQLNATEITAAIEQLDDRQADNSYDYQWDVSIPLHLRYFDPVNHTTTPLSVNNPAWQIYSHWMESQSDKGDEYSQPISKRTVPFPNPVVFWSCAGLESSDFKNNPFDRKNLGYDSFFPPNTIYYHIPPQVDTIRTNNLISFLKMPVLERHWTDVVKFGTIIAIMIGFIYVLSLMYSFFDDTFEDDTTNKKKSE